MNTPSNTFSNCPLSVLAVRAPHAPLILTGDVILTARTLDSSVKRLSAFLEKQYPKILREKTTALQFSSNSLLYLCLIVALYRLKIRTAFISPRTPHATVQKNLQELLKTSILLSDTETSTIPHSQLEATLIQPDSDTESGVNGSIENVSEITPNLLSIESTAPLQVLFTSASTHNAKAVVCTVAQQLQAAAVSNQALKLGKSSSWYLSLPLYHISGLGIWMRVLTAGAKLYLDPRPTFSPRALLDAVKKHSITHLSLVPTQLQRLLTYNDAESILKRCEVILLGGAPIPTSFWALSKKLPLVMSYGMSETLAHLALHHPKTSPPRAYTVLPSKHVKVENGRIYIGKTSLAEGYLDANGINKFPLTPEGFFSSGDRGRLDLAGHTRELYVWGRESNSLTSGGETFQCEEVEEVIYDALNELLPPSPTQKNLSTQNLELLSLKVRRVYVLGLPDENWGEVPVALLDLIRDPLPTPSSPLNIDVKADTPHTGTLDSVYRLEPNELSALSSLLKLPNSPNSFGLSVHLKKHLEAYKHPKAYYLLNQGADQATLKPYFTAGSLSQAKLSRPLLRKLLDNEEICRL